MNPFYQHIILPLQDFVYPPVCFTCDKLRTNRSSKICEECWGSVVSIDTWHPTSMEIKRKFTEEGFVQDVFSCYLFQKEGKLQDIIHLLKYRGIKSVGVELGKVIGRCMMMQDVTHRTLTRFMSADVLIPVPLHRTKQRERGYNQSEFLCKGISEVTHIPMHASLLVRKKYTQSQTLLNLEERRQNVGNAFRVGKQFLPHVKGKIFVLVDDVITTGSTINACARELLTHGAQCVVAASAALAE